MHFGLRGSALGFSWASEYKFSFFRSSVPLGVCVSLYGIHSTRKVVLVFKRDLFYSFMLDVTGIETAT